MNDVQIRLIQCDYNFEVFLTFLYYKINVSLVFSEMNLPNFAKMYTFYTKCFKLSSQCKFKAF